MYIWHFLLCCLTRSSTFFPNTQKYNKTNKTSTQRRMAIGLSQNIFQNKGKSTKPTKEGQHTQPNAKVNKIRWTEGSKHQIHELYMSSKRDNAIYKCHIYTQIYTHINTNIHPAVSRLLRFPTSAYQAASTNKCKISQNHQRNDKHCTLSYAKYRFC